ncbi:MAG: kinase/pyrophosphorylase [Chloroflexi bacterium]|nr:kinase/pyrophosphorylase [Chloroflexota bacterium]
MNRVFAVSDSTGITAEHVLSAALLQFAGAKVEIERRPGVRTEEQVRQVVQETAEVGGFIVHTLASDKLRQVMLRTGRLHNVETIDLMGPLLARLAQQLAVTPSGKPGPLSELTDEYFRRIETMEFAYRHDDGRRAHELAKAEIVLVGVSRTFKTPLSIYLAFKGWFVANVPIVLKTKPPAELFNLPLGRVCGLTINPSRLVEFRKVRYDHLGGAAGNYADPEHVQQEIEYAFNIFRSQHSWPVIEVTDKPIEEISSEILALVGRE